MVVGWAPNARPGIAASGATGCPGDAKSAAGIRIDGAATCPFTSLALKRPAKTKAARARPHGV
jgi:hypothetical protein